MPQQHAENAQIENAQEQSRSRVDASRGGPMERRARLVRNEPEKVGAHQEPVEDQV